MGIYKFRQYGRYAYESATHMKRNRREIELERAKKLTEDPEKASRRSAAACVICYYSSFIGGASCSSRPCGLCEIKVYSGSTNVPTLCLECAEANKLCRFCGADAELKLRRAKNFTLTPTPRSEEEKFRPEEQGQCFYGEG